MRPAPLATIVIHASHLLAAAAVETRSVRWALSASPLGVILSLGLAAIWYGAGVSHVWRTAGRGRGVTRGQVAAFAAGIVTLAVALLSPLDEASDALFSAHMVQHLLLIIIAAPLLVLGRPLAPLVWALPREWRQAVGQWWGRRPRTRAALTALGIPSVVWCLHAGALAFWHVPAPYRWALDNEWIHAVEHMTFLITACLFWWTVLPGGGGHRLGRGAAVFYVSALGALMGIFAAVLTFARSPWYTAHAGRTEAWGLTPLADQQLAGVIMWVPASAVYLAAASWCFIAWMRADDGAADTTLSRAEPST